MLLAKLKSFLAIAISLLILQGCGGWTVSQLQADLQPTLAQIELPKPQSRLEQLVLQELDKNILNTSQNKLYQLAFTVSAGGNSTVSVQGTSSKLRTSTTTLTFTLTEKSTGKTMLSDSLSASASSGAVSGLYANEKSSQFSGERLAKLLANRMIQSIALYIANTENGAQ